MVVACSDTGLYWEAGVQVAKCTNYDHQHQRFEVGSLPEPTEDKSISPEPLSA
jgi:hypothetical protein